MEQVLDIPTLKVTKYKCLTSLLFYTRYFFKHQYKRKFVINEHHQLICNTLERVLTGDVTRLIINMPPRFGKTELAVKALISHGLALNPSAKFIHLSYSDDLALDNSETVKDLVNSEEYQTLFPRVQIKKDSKAKGKWYTTEGGGVLARSTGGSVTGFGAGKVDNLEEDIQDFLITDKEGFNGCIVIDDPLKPLEADSDVYRDKVNNRFESTIRNRVNSRKTPIVIIMQRLHEKDLCGYLMQQDGYYTDIDAAHKEEEWLVLSLPAIKEDGTALWEFKHTLEELRRMESRDAITFQRQYMQNPMPREGFLYSDFKTYDPEMVITRKSYRKAYVDTADLGKDYLCSIVYDETDLGLYVRDVIYTQKAMEITEPLTAMQLTKYEVKFARIESNNGGRGFARNVGDHCKLLKNYKTDIKWFHQSDNKQVRIFTKQADVNNMVYMPHNWATLWPEFHKAVTQYQSIAKNNKHDDGPDALSGLVESIGVGMGSNWSDLYD